jgi:flagellar basal-body rod protein FlgG
MVVTADGFTVEPGVVIPQNARSVSISADGTVEAFLDNDTAPTQLGQFQLANFVNKSGLQGVGGNLYVETAASGTAQVGVPQADGLGGLLHKYLELSNVNAVTEISDLIAAQRAYEMNARVISGADEMLKAATNIF